MDAGLDTVLAILIAFDFALHRCTLRRVPILKREPDAFPESIFEQSTPWWVAHVRSRQEKVLARHLREHNVAFYLPQMEKRVRRAGRTLMSYLPLFSGYVFYRGGRDERLVVLKSNVVVNMLEPPDQSTIAAELEQLHRLQLTDAQLLPHPFVGPGDTVLITEGAFQGYRGVVLKEKGVTRLVVSVSFIRQSVALDIDREFIRPQRSR
jgi:transcription antitermination factor NusG